MVTSPQQRKTNISENEHENNVIMPWKLKEDRSPKLRL